jgi:hypothetical protein
MCVIPATSALHGRLTAIAATQRIAVFAGLPGVGKSLLVQQLAILASRAGRKVHLLQWDVARSAFETPTMMAHYPEVNGFTHVMIIKAVGLWIRSAVLGWHQQFAGREHLLIGECALVGNRLMELVEPAPDPCERLLAGSETVFLLPVPAPHVRAVIEHRRRQTSAAPQHERESADAPPNVVRRHWQEIVREGVRLGLTDSTGSLADVPYRPDVYEGVYRHWLRHRRVEVVALDEVFTVNHSVYDLDVLESELRATPEEVERIGRQLRRNQA